MTTHAFRWRGLIFGLIFVAIAGGWAAWKQDLLTQQQFSFTVSAVLIVFGILGVIATFWRPAPRPPSELLPAPGADLSDPHPTAEVPHEDPDPQP
ncbi:MAG: hypothetical protein WBQ48_11815 [Aeromicrobium sp.]